MNQGGILLAGLLLASLSAGGFAAAEHLSFQPNIPEAELNADITRKPPVRSLGQQALVLHENSDFELRVLLVEPVHCDGYTLPGGGSESDELPHLAARRHLESATGLVLPLRTVLTVDYVTRPDRPEALDLVYAGGIVTLRQAKAMCLYQLPEAVRALHWVPRHQLDAVMEPARARRVHDAWDAWEHGAGRPLLLDGVPVPIH